MDATILVVEDDPSIRELTQRGLQQAGFARPKAVWMEKGAWAVVQAKK